jgi:hypothetical protein
MDEIVIPATECWVGQGAQEQSGMVIVGLTLATGEKAAVGLTPELASEVARLITVNAQEARMKQAPVFPVFRKV